MKKYRWIATIIFITFGLLGCGDEGGNNIIDKNNSNTENEILTEHYNSEKKLFPSKITTIQYDTLDTTKKVLIITSTFKYNNKNLMIEQNTTMGGYNETNITVAINIEVKYDNQGRYIEHEGTQKDYIPNQPIKIGHSSAKVKYEHDKIAEEYYYTEEVLYSKWIVTKWDGDKPIKRQNITYSKEGQEIDKSTQINTYEGKNIIHTELHKSDGSIDTTDRVFDDKKIPEWNDVVQRKYYTYCDKGKNNILSETLVSPRSTLTVENKLKYNDKDMLIQEDSYRHYSDSDYILREKTTIEYEAR